MNNGNILIQRFYYASVNKYFILPIRMADGNIQVLILLSPVGFFIDFLFTLLTIKLIWPSTRSVTHWKYYKYRLLQIRNEPIFEI